MSEYAKPQVATDAGDTLGTIIEPGEKRDAIHNAVFAVEAAGQFRPGDHVSLRDGKAVHAGPGHGLGIVDPFLLDFVEPGQWFWLIVYPRQISSLRHVWEHPAFPPSELDGVVINGEMAPELLVGGQDSEAFIAIDTPKRTTGLVITKEFAEAWLNEWAEANDIPAELMMETLSHGGEWHDDEDAYFGGRIDEERFMIYGRDGYATIPAEFWVYAEAFYGAPLPHRPPHFACSC